MSEDYTRFKGITDITKENISQTTEANVIHFFDWSLLGIGGYSNVYLNSSGAYGSNLSSLRRVDEPNYTANTVYEGFRSNWVYESGVEYSPAPISISGIYVNNNYYPASTTGVYAHTINYPLGRVIFNSALPANTNVNLEYSYKKVNMLSARSSYSKTLLFDSYRPDNNNFSKTGSGIYNTLSQARIQLPCIVVKSIDDRQHIPMDLGGGYYAEQDVIFYIYTEDPTSIQTLSDVCLNQYKKTIYFYNRNDVLRDGRLPLTHQGALNPSGYNYPQLVQPPSPHGNGYRYKRAWFKKINKQNEEQSSKFCSTIVRFSFEIDCPEL